MSKAEKFIQDCTRNNCWLIKNEALEAVEIAREEAIKEVCEWIKNNIYTYVWYEFTHHEKGIETDELIVEDLKKHLEGKK